jgi:hypothetical protein
MMQSSSRPASELGDLVRKATRNLYKGSWPKVSVWHGSADRTVNPANANEIVKQWLDVHQLPITPMSAGEVDGYPREVWWNVDGETVVESYTITDMAHGTPLGISGSDEHYGAEGAFMIEAGISSSYHIANFFGLTERVSQPNEIAVPAVGSAAKPVATAAPRPEPRPAAKKIPEAVMTPATLPDLAATLWPRARPVHQAKPAHAQPRRGIDVGAVITRALTAAGLMK